MKFDCDILISGGGIAGLTAAAAFGTAGFNVICVDPAPPVTERDAAGADMRSTAMLQPAREVLENAGVWDELAPHAAPLQIMRIVDAGGEVAEPRVVREFNASEISEQPFGWNFPNWLLRHALVARLKALTNVDFRPGTGTRSLFTRTASAKVGLTDGTSITTPLVIAADGRGSPMREAAGIDVTTRRYGQKALAFAVTHPVPHENVSTEIHRTGGPFTLVPLPDRDGMPSSAIVWMDDGPLTQARAEMDVTAFAAEMTERSCSLFGPLTLASPRNCWPIISQHAARLNGERVALIAEAAHVLPPIGAQGLNMSLKDVSTLLGLAQKSPEDLGSATMLEAYHKARYGDIQLRVNGIDMLNRVSQASSPLARDIRATGLDALYAMAPVRKLLMQMGLGMR
ncbi:2-octaprenyl-6-methoxyphenol hydroxylase [Sulfitobacter noctilucicola]|uniref:2-octaprenyl-6-methoxyphenol hydroxylase n=1 Tax=Sulfitobacter noctilucicola TaxID=1342301 RepID=A0A7W6Q3J6_9RHOB|nr:UbiH/UbiF family hydroxylase [Sulfitobacter noctilucicola]KIN64555.1 2-octaprenyl-6-methoxyphenol hydroxylase [Sulfitobacter noctilucicola]MBB4174290.1 2-octaprenyl-6-methoxyphenol hydroxylase [Sulfitobacter noctilucicola]